MIGRLLCRLGLHWWETSVFYSFTTAQCGRCGVSR